MTTFDLLLQLNAVDHSQYLNVCRTYFGIYKHIEVSTAIARLNLASNWRLRSDILARLNITEFDVTPSAVPQGIYAHFPDASFVAFEYADGVKKPLAEDGKVRPMTAYEAAELCHYRRDLHPALDLRSSDRYLVIDDDYFKHRADYDPAVLAARLERIEQAFGYHYIISPSADAATTYSTDYPPCSYRARLSAPASEY
jgi:hypothetical protein